MNTLKVIYKHSMHLIPQNKVKENSGKAFAILQKKQLQENCSKHLLSLQLCWLPSVSVASYLYSQHVLSVKLHIISAQQELIYELVWTERTFCGGTNSAGSRTWLGKDTHFFVEI